MSSDPNNPSDPPPPLSNREFQAGTIQVLADLNECIAKRAEHREQLLRTKNSIDDMTVANTLGDESAVRYLLSQAQALAEIAIGYHDDLVADLIKQRDSMARIVERN